MTPSCRPFVTDMLSEQERVIVSANAPTEPDLRRLK
jgi:hypothetical protein